MIECSKVTERKNECKKEREKSKSLKESYEKIKCDYFTFIPKIKGIMLSQLFYYYQLFLLPSFPEDTEPWSFDNQA